MSPSPSADPEPGANGSQSSRAAWFRLPPTALAVAGPADSPGADAADQGPERLPAELLADEDRGMSAAAVVLRPWPFATARAVLAGGSADRADWHPDYPMLDTVDALAMVLAAYEVDAPLTAAPRWWVQQVRYGGQVVGDVGFHGPPAADGPLEVEIGYGIVPECRGRGVATAACGQLLALAWRLGADTVLAGADADNLASRRVLQRTGFHERSDGTFAIGRPA